MQIFSRIKKLTGRTQGFTLIELLVVIAIIGILSAVVLVSLNNARVRARDSRRQGDLTSLVAALELYADDNSGAYLDTAIGDDACVQFNSMVATLRTSGYLGSSPIDPRDTVDVWDNDPTGDTNFCYGYIANNATTATANCPATFEYLIAAQMEQGINNDAALNDGGCVVDVGFSGGTAIDCSLDGIFCVYQAAPIP